MTAHTARRRPLTGSLPARRVLGHGATYLVLLAAAEIGRASCRERV